MTVPVRLVALLKQIGGGQVKRPNSLEELIQEARQRGFDDVANWLEANPAQFEFWMAAIATAPK